MSYAELQPSSIAFPGFMLTIMHYNKNEKSGRIILFYVLVFQVKLSVSGRDLNVTLIARRSRHYAGTRFGHCSRIPPQVVIWLSYILLILHVVYFDSHLLDLLPLICTWKWSRQAT